MKFCDPTARVFPRDWVSTYFRHNLSKTGKDHYECPICKTCFDHTQIDCLCGDHIWPYSLMGETSWDNYQLLCRTCNVRKKNFINNEVRKVLGDGSFRGMVFKYIKDRINIPYGISLDEYICFKHTTR